MISILDYSPASDALQVHKLSALNRHIPGSLYCFSNYLLNSQEHEPTASENMPIT